MPEHISSPLIHDVRSLPERPSPTPLPDAFNEFCAVCKSTIPEAICCCEPSGVLICGHCISNHNLKYLSKVHILLPMKARRYISAPGYLDRLRQRQVALENGTKEAEGNLQNMEKCVKELNERVERTMEAIQKYKQEQLAEIQKIRLSLQQALLEATQEVSEHIYEDNYEPQGNLAKVIWTHQPGALALFSYKTVGLYEVSISNGLLNVLVKPRTEPVQPKFTPTGTPRDRSPRGSISSPAPFSLPRLAPTAISHYNLSTNVYDRTIPLRPPIDSSHTSSAVLLPSGRLFVCGKNAKPCSNRVFEVDCETGITTELPSMLIARFVHGLVAYNNSVFILGGSGLSGFLTSCEKFIFTNRQYSRLQDMNYGRDYFNPCRIRQFLYVCGGRNTSACEKYDIGNDRFILLNVKLPGAGHTASVVNEDNSLILLQGGTIIRLDLATEKLTVTKTKKVPGAVWGSVNPVKSGRDIYIPQFYTAKLVHITI